MSEQLVTDLDRRRFLTRVVPACSLACLYSGAAGADGAADSDASGHDGIHKFDVQFDRKISARQRVTEQNGELIELIKTLRGELDEEELIRLLELYSADYGRRVGQLQAESTPDTSFRTFVANFRPPNYANSLTHEVTEDSEKVFQLRVTECVWAEVFRDAGLGGRIGHAAVCNMDYYWPTAFNKNFKMERDKTLMQGHEHCNHRYLDTSS